MEMSTVTLELQTPKFLQELARAHSAVPSEQDEAGGTKACTNVLPSVIKLNVPVAILKEQPAAAEGMDLEPLALTRHLTAEEAEVKAARKARQKDVCAVLGMPAMQAVQAVHAAEAASNSAPLVGPLKGSRNRGRDVSHMLKQADVLSCNGDAMFVPLFCFCFGASGCDPVQSIRSRV